jgi:hypothetical protein
MLYDTDFSFGPILLDSKQGLFGHTLMPKKNQTVPKSKRRKPSPLKNQPSWLNSQALA